MAIQYANEHEPAHKEGKSAQQVALEEFVSMNRLRMVLTEVPLIIIAVAGAL